MRRALLALAAAVALAAPASAAAEDFAISMPGRFFDPQRLTVVAGDAVSWRNADLVTHEVRATGGAFDSGALSPRAAYAHRFDAPGSYALVCPLHPFMTGTLDVVAATLAGPGSAVAGESVRLTGRAAGSAPVTLEQRRPDGSWSAAGEATPAADGSFAFAVTARETAAYRALAAAGPSSVVTLTVSAHVGLAVRVHGNRVAVRATPPQAGLAVSLQRYSRERFAWRRIAHATTDRRGAATLRLRPGLRGTVRVLLSREPGAAALATSAAVRLRDGRLVADPGGHPMR